MPNQYIALIDQSIRRDDDGVPDLSSRGGVGMLHPANDPATGQPRIIQLNGFPIMFGGKVWLRYGDTSWVCISSDYMQNVDPPPPPSTDTVIARVEITTPPPPALSIGVPLQLSGAAKNKAGFVLASPIFTWASSDPAVATISQTGLVLPLQSGDTIITLSYQVFTYTMRLIVAPVSPPSISHPYFLNVSNAAMVFVAPNRASAVLGSFPPDPAWQNPIQLSAGTPLANDDRMWRQVLNCADLKLIGGWVVEGEPGYSVRYFYQPPQ